MAPELLKFQRQSLVRILADLLRSNFLVFNGSAVNVNTRAGLITVISGIELLTMSLFAPD